MALLTQTLVKARLSVEYAAPDTNGKIIERTKSIEFELHGVDDPTKIANAIVDVDAYLVDLAAMTEADISGHTVTMVYDTGDALTGTEANLYKELLITLIPGTAGERDMAHSIPAPADGRLANGETLIVDATAQAYLDNFEAAPTGYARLSDGSYITGGSSQVRTSRVKSVSSGKKYG